MHYTAYKPFILYFTLLLVGDNGEGEKIFAFERVGNATKYSFLDAVTPIWRKPRKIFIFLVIGVEIYICIQNVRVYPLFL